MTNKHTHHSSQSVFHRQADTLTVQQLPTDGLVQTVKRTTAGGYAGPPHNHPLDAEKVFVITRVSVRQQAQQTPGRPDAAPTHQLLAEKGTESLLHKREGVSPPYPGSNSTTSFGTNTMRPSARVYPQAIGERQERGVRRDPDSAHGPQKSLERPLGV